MALINNGVLLALCATLAVAVKNDDISPPEHGEYHEPHNPHFSAQNRMESTSNENELIKEHHGHHNTHHNSGESHKHHGKWEHKNHHLGGQNHNLLQNLEHSKETEEVARRRPLGFYPFGPHYPYHRPHASPSNNDEEFEAIEARASGNHHGHYNPHFPLKPDNSEESGEPVPYWFFHHKPHFPLIPFFHPGSQKPESNSDQGIESDEANVDGSGEEEIVPFSDKAADNPLLRDDVATTYQNDEQYEDIELSDDVSSVNLINLLETRKSIPIECDALNSPRFSCYNCYNYVECKVGGGKIKSCKDPYAPYCNGGICSDVPGPDCSNL